MPPAAWPVRPPAVGATLRVLARLAHPPRAVATLAWLDTQAHAAMLLDLARGYLAGTDARTIARLLRAGRHGPAAQRFVDAFAQRWFPLAYPWSDGASGRLLVELADGIQPEGYGDLWEEYADLWGLKPVFLLSWALLEDPFSDLEADLAAEAPDELGEAEVRGYRWRDQARDAIAELTGRPVAELFAGVPDDGVPITDLEPRLLGTEWEPLLWAAPWLWRLSVNAFLDRCPAEEQPEAEPWSCLAVFRLGADNREALRIMRAVDALDTRLTESPSECARHAIRAALGPPSGRLSTLLDLPIVHAAPGQRP